MNKFKIDSTNIQKTNENDGSKGKSKTIRFSSEILATLYNSEHYLNRLSRHLDQEESTIFYDDFHSNRSYDDCYPKGESEVSLDPYKSGFENGYDEGEKVGYSIGYEQGERVGESKVKTVQEEFLVSSYNRLLVGKNNKFMLILVETGAGRFEAFIVSENIRQFEYHKHILNKHSEIFRSRFGESTHIQNMGGGYIDVDNTNRTITLYKHSEDYGKYNKEVALRILKKHYKGYKLNIS